MTPDTESTRAEQLSADLTAAMAVPDALPELPAGVAEAEPEPEPGTERRSVATQLVELALERYSLGITPDGEPYALPSAGGHVVTMLRDGRASLRAELAREFFRAVQKAPTSSALTDAMGVLEGFAKQEAPVELHLRTASHEGVVYIDIGDIDNHVVRIAADGWSLITSAVPVRFRRTTLTGAFPLPNRAGSLDDLWSILNIDESDRVLILAFMVSALIQPDEPHPVLTFFAEQGSGKSSATRRVVDLLDPSPVPLRKSPRDPDSWIVAASGSWVVALDNLSTVQEWFSDALCRACTGDGDVKRALYTDGSLAIVKFRRCIIANGIDVGALRGDLSERLLSVPLYPIPSSERMLESDIEARWMHDYPGVLGALLDLCVEAMSALPSVVVPGLPRMADFARLLGALDLVLETEGLKSYLHRTDYAAADSLSADPFVARLREMLTEPFEGTAGELMSKVQPLLVGGSHPRGWPRNPRDVTRSLKRNAPALRTCGWTVINDEGHNQSSIFRWSIAPPTSGTHEGGRG